MANFVETTLQDIDSRLKELQEEVARLTAAREALAGPTRRRPGRPRGSTNSTAAPTRRRARAARPRGRRRGATRATQAQELVKSNPGITIPKIAESLKIEPNYLYRVMPKLIDEGTIKRDGLGYYPVEAAK